MFLLGETDKKIDFLYSVVSTLKSWASYKLVRKLTFDTLSFYNNGPSKNKHFLILLSSLARNSQKPKLKRIFEIPGVLFEKSLSLYFNSPKSWIWRTLEKVMNIFCKWHFHNASNEVFWQKKILNFMHRFKSAILAKNVYIHTGSVCGVIFVLR